ncbi:MAG TPA: tetratricopeptide repeat protein [Burkholderiales bacterium]|nr:tetratricopeptide repeat protein [Burkholderiales bacterium]
MHLPTFALRFLPFVLAVFTSGTTHAQDNGERLRTGWIAFESAESLKAYRLLLPLADQGNKYAAYAVGELLLDGNGVARDVPRAIPYLRRAAEQEIPVAQERMGAVYYFGLNTARDYAMAAQWFERAARNGYAQAQGNLALMAGQGQGMPRDQERARYWLEQAMAQDDANALNTYAGLLMAGSGDLARDDARALALYRRAADLGSAAAMNNLGGAYRDGEQVPQNFDTARRWFEKSAARRLPQAYTSLGALYLQGQGVARDPERAQGYFRRAAQSSEPQAEYNMGSMYLRGDGVRSDRAAAQFWLALAAAHGSAQAKAHMIVFARATDASDDARRYAPAYFNDLAAGSDAELQMLVGELYIDGVIVPPDRGEARRWFDFAARHGNARATERLKVLGG